MARWLGVKALVHDAVDATVELVRTGQSSALRSVLRLTDQVDGIGGPARQIGELQAAGSGATLDVIRFINRAMEKLTDTGLSLAEIEDSEAAPVEMTSTTMGSADWNRDALVGALNGALGDHLERRGSSLDMGMHLRLRGAYVNLETPDLEGHIQRAELGPRLAVFVHGVATSEWSWCLESERYHGDASSNFATMLKRDLDVDAVFVRYNTGRHISTNGAKLSALLKVLATASSAKEFILVGHSMGGLVLHAASKHGERESAAWPRKVQHIFYLGSPHAGAPLAKLGQFTTDALGRIDLPATQIIAKILEARSAGVHDLRHGAVADEDWLAPHPLARDALPLEQATHHFISATLSEDPNHPAGQLIGDLLVRVPSASAPAIERHFPIRTSVYGGVLHHQMQNHPAIYEELRRALQGTPAI